MGKTIILQANLGDFDTTVDPVAQKTPVDFFRWTDENFPPITGLTPRLQYRIPKLFGWEMKPGYDHYIWLDGGCSFKRDDCATYYLSQLNDADIAFFKHPNRYSIRQEVDHIEDHLKKGKPYITSRYKNGLHKEMYDVIKRDLSFIDKRLYASTTFVYRNSPRVQQFMHDWWFYQSRYFTVDQICLPWLLWKHNLQVVAFDEPIYKSGYMSLVSKHR